MVSIPFPATSAPSIKPDESSGRLINAFAEKIQDGGRTSILLRRVAGLTQWGNSAGRVNVRGMMVSGSSLYVAYDNFAVKYDNAGSPTLLGLMPAQGLVTMAANQASTPQILASTNNELWQITDTTTLHYHDANLGGDCNSICHINQKFIATKRNGQVFYSDPVSIVFDSLNFFTAESAADSLLRGLIHRQELYLFGAATIEVWRDVGDGFARVTVIPKGALAAGSIGGFRNEAQQEFENLIWVGDDKAVYVMNGYTPQRISTHDVERSIKDADIATLRSFGYVIDGHKFWTLSSSTWTWEYNLTTGQWHERKSWLMNKWRASQAIQAFGKWLVGDEISGKIFEVSQSVYTEDGDTILVEITSGQADAFPNRIAVHRTDFDVSTAQVLSAGANPKLLVRWSDDGGYTWSAWVYTSLGRLGKSKSRATINRCGMTGQKGRIYQINMSENIHFSLQGADMVVEKLSAA